MNNLWRVTLFHRDSRTYPRIIVSASSEREAMVAACKVENAPLRSVLKVEAYHETN